MAKTRVWILLELEHDADEADVEDLVSRVLDTGEFQDAINERAQITGPELRVTAALSDLDSEPLREWAEQHDRVGSSLGGQ
jgi:hypothetical protein